MRDAFESWIGKEVVLQLGFGLVRVSLRGVLLRDLTETLLMKPEVGTDIKIAKTKVLAIEELERRSRSLPWLVLSGSFVKAVVDQDIQPITKTRA